MQLTNTDIANIDAALKQFDGYQALTADKQTVFVPYKFSAATKLKLRKNRRLVEEPMKDLMDARNSLIKSINPDGKIENGTPAMDGFQKGWKELCDISHELDFAPISVEELNLDENPIPDSVLGLIEKIIIGL